MDARNEVLAFSEIMEQKLKENDHKSHWTEESYSYLLERLEEEVSELKEKIGKIRFGGGRALADDSIEGMLEPEPEEIQRECADVANFAMMIADNIQKLTYATPPTKPVTDAEIDKQFPVKHPSNDMAEIQDALINRSKRTGAKWHRDKAITRTALPREGEVFYCSDSGNGAPEPCKVQCFNCQAFQSSADNEATDTPQKRITKN